MRKVLFTLIVLLSLFGTAFANTYLNLSVPASLGFGTSTDKAGNGYDLFTGGIGAGFSILGASDTGATIGLDASMSYNQSNYSLGNNNIGKIEVDFKGLSFALAPVIGFTSDDNKMVTQFLFYPIAFQYLTFTDIEAKYNGVSASTSEFTESTTRFKTGFKVCIGGGTSDTKGGVFGGMNLLYTSDSILKGNEFGFEFTIGYNIIICSRSSGAKTHAPTEKALETFDSEEPNDIVESSESSES